MVEKRDYKGNNFGRRPYDKNLATMCLQCDLRREVKEKVSWKHLVIILGIIGSIIGAGLSISMPPAIHGIERMMETSKSTLNAINTVNAKVIVIETKQQTILNRLNKNKRSKHKDEDDD